ALEIKHSRQVLVLGEEGQKLVEKLNVGIVGLGGTGSCAAEQLARLGVNRFLLIDDDTFEESNITRMFGTGARDMHRKFLGRFQRAPKTKVALIAKHLRSINRDVIVEPIFGNVVHTPVATKLL